MKNFITFEGCEGVGKTSQIKLLKAYCDEKGLDTFFTREPGGSRIAESIREIVLDTNNQNMDGLCEAFLFAAARIQHLKETILPALEAGKIVFCDRFVDSSYAYQGFGRALGLDFVRNLNKLAVGEYMPELTIFLDLPPNEAFIRKGGFDASDRIEQGGSDFYERLYNGYKEIVRQEPKRVYAVSAAGTKMETHQAIVSLLQSKGIF